MALTFESLAQASNFSCIDKAISRLKLLKTSGRFKVINAILFSIFNRIELILFYNLNLQGFENLAGYFKNIKP
jgi:hypothetical protein